MIRIPFGLFPSPINSNIHKTKYVQTKFNIWRRYCTDNLAKKFQEFVKNAAQLKEDPTNETKLKLYALFKQATIGPCNTPKPGISDIVGKYKWNVWNNLGQMSKEDAMKNYINQVQELMKSIGITEGTSSTSSFIPSSASTISLCNGDILITNREGVLTLKLNRPQKRNAITLDMYIQITNTLNSSASDDKVNFVVFTGEGEYYSSGNDLSNFMISRDKDLLTHAQESKTIFYKFVDSFIKIPKPMIAVVNGPAVGITVTTLPLFDVVVCSDTATFHCPFSALAQSPEGCSSYTFPRIMGYSKANSMLLFNHKMTAKEALDTGLVSEIVPKNELESYLDKWIYSQDGLIKTCNNNSLTVSKRLIRNENIVSTLEKVNQVESEVLMNCWLTPEFPKVIEKFFARKLK